MESTDNEQLIKAAKICMIFAGYWKRPIGGNDFYLKLYSHYSLLMPGAFLSLWILLVAELVRLNINRYDSIVIISSLSVIVNATKIIAKIVIFKKNNVLDLYEDVIANEKQIWASEDTDIKKSYKKYVAFCRRLMFCQVFSTTITVFAFGIMGIVADHQLKQFNCAYNASLESHHWYQFWFPGSKLDHLVIVYALNTIFSWSALIYNCITHMITVTLSIYAVSQLHTLRIRMSKYDKDGKTLEQFEKVLRLKHLINKHIDLIRFIKTLNRKTKNVLLMEFLLSSVDVSSVAVNLAKETSLQTVWHSIYFLLLILQILVMAWTTNEIKVQSVSLADGLYETEWYAVDKECAQLIHIVMMRAQRPLALTIGPFGPMTTETALKVFIRSDISYSFGIYVSIKPKRVLDHYTVPCDKKKRHRYSMVPDTTVTVPCCARSDPRFLCWDFWGA